MVSYTIHMTAVLNSTLPANLPNLDARPAVQKVLEAIKSKRAQLEAEIATKKRQLDAALAQHGAAVQEAREIGKRAAVAGALAATLLVTPGASPFANKVASQAGAPAAQASQKEAPNPVNVSGELTSLLPDVTAAPSSAQENQVGQMLSRAFNINVAPELEGHRLNVVLSMMGGEQHLRRFPGDAASNHDSPNIPTGAGGMAPGNGAYGMWESSKAALTDQDINEERYYIAVQTFLAPGFRDNTNEVYNWFRHRKMLAVNAKTGQACVVVVGDAGPATWTGKNSGGSPEVLDLLGLGAGPRKGKVLLYFVDDPENKVPLGQIIPTDHPAPTPAPDAAQAAPEGGK